MSVVGKVLDESKSDLDELKLLLLALCNLSCWYVSNINFQSIASFVLWSIASFVSELFTSLVIYIFLIGVFKIIKSQQNMLFIKDAERLLKNMNYYHVVQITKKGRQKCLDSWLVMSHTETLKPTDYDNTTPSPA